jgi:hypothetical protein
MTSGRTAQRKPKDYEERSNFADGQSSRLGRGKMPHCHGLQWSLAAMLQRAPARYFDASWFFRPTPRKNFNRCAINPDPLIGERTHAARVFARLRADMWCGVYATISLFSSKTLAARGGHSVLRGVGHNDRRQPVHRTGRPARPKQFRS